MTDERIKEEVEKWADNGKPSTEAERAFWQDQKDLNGRALAYGFYAGFRAAERLAKIEVLEETYDAVGEIVYSRDEYDIYDRVQLLMANMLSDLKGEL